MTIRTYPNTLLALFKAIVDATHFASKAENRKAMAEAIAPKNYLNQPMTVLEQVLTGKYADGLSNIKEVPDRINFDPFPWHAMAVWLLTQMKCWKHVDSDLDYKQVAEQVYLAAECDKISGELGSPSHAQTLHDAHRSR